MAYRARSTVFDAIKLMAEKNIGALLVLSRDRLVGIFTERDYTRKMALMGKTSKDTRVREVLSGNVICVPPGDSVEECMRLMTEHRVRHLPVVEGGKVLGIVSIGDLVNWIISAQKLGHRADGTIHCRRCTGVMPRVFPSFQGIHKWLELSGFCRVCFNFG